jgi:branched-chain amino acid transport system permease protein
MNFAHGALFMLGAYIGYSVSGLLDFWAALVVAPVALALLGVAFEYATIRPLQKRSRMDVALVTFGLALMLSQLVIKIWGTAPLAAAAPLSLAGSMGLFGQPYPTYRLFLIAVGFSVCIALAAWLKYTRTGMHVRAVSQRPTIARILCVNTDRLGLLVFAWAQLSPVSPGCWRGPIFQSTPPWALPF